MFKKPSNPDLEKLEKSHSERRINLSNLEPIIIDGKKFCVWCKEPLKGRQYKWCSPLCSNSAFAWANPQKEEGLNILLARQNWKCADCEYDYIPIAEKCLTNLFGWPKNYREEICVRIMKRIKRLSPKDRKPEVDHIMPIYKGGKSIGFSNHQVLCFTCHKKKTSKDLKKNS